MLERRENEHVTYCDHFFVFSPRRKQRNAEPFGSEFSGQNLQNRDDRIWLGFRFMGGEDLLSPCPVCRCRCARMFVWTALIPDTRRRARVTFQRQKQGVCQNSPQPRAHHDVSPPHAGISRIIQPDLRCGNNLLRQDPSEPKI